MRFIQLGAPGGDPLNSRASSTILVLLQLATGESPGNR